MTTNPLDDEAEIIIGRSYSLGLVTLNRPRVLNSLNLKMVRQIEAALDRFEDDPDVSAILLQAEGGRAFCAGGDIRMIYESGKGGHGQAELFWREEYRLLARIHHFPKPIVVLLDGLAMGGGVGLSTHASHRIATERLKLAMPETGIGFFPDVGTTWRLSRAPGETGTYLGLTGEIVGPEDAISVGLADHLVPHERLEALVETLSSSSRDMDAASVSATIRRFATGPEPGTLSVHRKAIDMCFAPDTMEDIVNALAADGSAFAQATLKTLKARSPTALKIALAMLRAGRNSRSLEECLDREFAGAAAILTLPDFYEGVRAAVIDKDRNPRWSPSSLSEVSESELARFFASRPDIPFSTHTGDPRNV